jgi:predicted fused transcriptional regulator/phosphomethylpyrimidine kinase
MRAAAAGVVAVTGRVSAVRDQNTIAQLLESGVLRTTIAVAVRLHEGQEKIKTAADAKSDLS